MLSGVLRVDLVTGPAIPLNILLKLKFMVTVLCHGAFQRLLTADYVTLSSPETIRKENKVKVVG